MDYMTLKEAGEKWGVTPRWINYYCSSGRIPGAVKAGCRMEGLKKHNLKNMKRSSYQLLTDTSFSVYSLFPVIK